MCRCRSRREAWGNVRHGRRAAQEHVGQADASPRKSEARDKADAAGAPPDAGSSGGGTDAAGHGAPRSAGFRAEALWGDLAPQPFSPHPAGQASGKLGLVNFQELGLKKHPPGAWASQRIEHLTLGLGSEGDLVQGPM